MALRTSPARKKIRANGRSTIPPVPPEDGGDDEDEDDDQALDVQLALFLRRPPTAADHFVCLAQSGQGDQVVQDRSAAEVRQLTAARFANELVGFCDRWAKSEGREVRFRGTWQSGDRVLGSYSWRSGYGDPMKLDGTVESMFMQMQRSFETKDRMNIESLGMLKDGWHELLKLAYKRIAELELSLATANDRLKKAGDVDAEIAITTSAAAIQQRERFADIIEGRVMPIMQAMAVRYLGSPPGVVVPAQNPQGEGGGQTPTAAKPS